MMLKTYCRIPYESPRCNMMELMQNEVLCLSNTDFSGSTEDVGELDDFFGSGN